MLVMLELRENMRSRELPALWVGGRTVGVRSKDCRREVTVADCEVSGRLKSPVSSRGVPSSGKELRSISSSSGKCPRGPGGAVESNNGELEWAGDGYGVIFKGGEGEIRY